MVSLRVEEDKARQRKQGHTKHDRHEKNDLRAEALENRQERSFIETQNIKLINQVNRLLNRRLKSLGVSKEEFLEVEEQEREREEKLKRGQEDPDRPVEKTQEEIDQENLRMLEDLSISDEIVNPPVARFQGRLLTSDEVATAAIIQFTGGQYDFEPNLMKIPYIPGQGRVGIACETVRSLVFQYMIMAMKKKFAPDELEEMWLSVMETGIILPEVCKIADDAIKFMLDKLTPEEMALTTPAKLAAMIVKAMKEAYCQSKEAENKLKKKGGVIFEDDEDGIEDVGDITGI